MGELVLIYMDLTLVWPYCYCYLQDYLQRRNGYPVKIRYPSGMDKTHRRRIMSFLADNGWIGITWWL